MQPRSRSTDKAKTRLSLFAGTMVALGAGLGAVVADYSPGHWAQVLFVGLGLSLLALNFRAVRSYTRETLQETTSRQAQWNAHVAEFHALHEDLKAKGERLQQATQRLRVSDDVLELRPDGSFGPVTDPGHAAAAMAEVVEALRREALLRAQHIDDFNDGS